MKSKTSNRSRIELAPELIEWVAERPAFLYPELLPTSALKPSGKSGKDDKPYFAKAEDNLIALGKFFNPIWTGEGGVPMNSKLLEFFTYHLNLSLKFFFRFLSNALRN